MPNDLRITGHRVGTSHLPAHFDEFCFVDGKGNELAELPTFIVGSDPLARPSSQEFACDEIVGLHDRVADRWLRLAEEPNPGTDDPGEHIQPGQKDDLFRELGSVANLGLPVSAFMASLRKFNWLDASEMFGPGGTDDSGAEAPPEIAQTDDFGDAEPGTDDWGEEE